VHPVLEAALIGDCSTQATLSPVVLMPTPAYKRRSRHTPGGVELPRTDGRTIAAKRYRALVEHFTHELGGGTLSAVDAGLVRQAAALSLRIEQLQASIVSGEPVNNDETVRLSSEHRRILASLRSRVAKNKPGPSLADWLAARQAEKAAAT
jgi:hypothetical protein